MFFEGAMPTCSAALASSILPEDMRISTLYQHHIYVCNNPGVCIVPGADSRQIPKG
jgi:hypothetical protein